MGDRRPARLPALFMREIVRLNGELPGVEKDNGDGSSVFRAFKWSQLPAEFLVTQAGERKTNRLKKEKGDRMDNTNDLALTTAPAGNTSGELSEQSRAIAEIQSRLIIAKRFPRNPEAAVARILTACKRRALAGEATYTFPREGARISGPSIRLAEVLAQN